MLIKPIPIAQGVKRNKEEVLFSSSSILMDSDRTLQEEWNLHVAELESLKEAFDQFKVFIGENLAVPYQKKPLTFSQGAYQTPDFAGYTKQFMSISGQTTGINAGTYSVTFKLNSPSYVWSDGTTEDKTVVWTINPQQIPVPVQQTPYEEYDGSLKTPVWANNANLHIIIVGGTAETSSAGIHLVTVKPETNYCWFDGTTTEKEISWSIKRKTVNLPVQTNTIHYDGKSHIPEFNYNDTLLTIVQGSTSGIDAQDYSVWFKPTDNAAWLDGSTSMKKVTWTILPAPLEFNVTGPDGLTNNIKITFTGEQIMPTFEGYDPSFIDAYDITSDADGNLITSDILTHRDTGTYITRFTPKEGFVWNGSTNSIIVQWSIEPMVLPIPYLSSDNETANVSVFYTGDTIGPEKNNYDPHWIIVDYATGITTGSYTAKFTLREANNTVWSTGDTQPKTQGWQIIPKLIKVPIVLQSEVPYNGGYLVHPIIEEYDKRFIDVTGDSATNIGTGYQLEFNLKDPVNTKWNDGAIDHKITLWSVTAIEVPVPDITNLSFVYDKTEQGPDISDYDKELIMISDYKFTDVGQYTMTLSLLLPGTVWSDTKDSMDKTVSWKIGPRIINTPVISNINNKVWNDTIQYVTVHMDNIILNNSQYDHNSYVDDYIKITGMSGKLADTYTATISLLDKYNTVWSSGSTGDIITLWTINKKPVNVPVITGTYTYTGEEQKCIFESYNSSWIDVTNNTATDAGTYVVNLDLVNKKNFAWPDGTVNTKTLVWTINKQLLDPSSLSLLQSSFVFDDQEHQISEADIDGLSDLFVADGTFKAVSAGNYTITVDIKDKKNYAWLDQPSTYKVNLFWTINKLILNIPYVTLPNTKYTYTGKTYTITQNDITLGNSTDIAYIDIRDNTGKETGVHTVKFCIKDEYKHDVIWSDGTTEDKTDFWKIDKAYLKQWSVANTTVNVTGNPGSYEDVKVYRDGNGEVRVTTDSPYMTAMVLESTGITPTVRFIDLAGPVQTTASISVREGTNYYSSDASNVQYPSRVKSSITINVNILTGNKPAYHTPERIREIITDGLAEQVWIPGDIIPIKFNKFKLFGSSTVTIPADTYDAVILGFDHNKTAENGSAKHTVTVAVMHPHNVSETIAFFDPNSNVTDACNGTYNDNIFNAIHDDWKDIIIPTLKWSTETLSWQSHNVFSLSCFEVHGNGGPGNGIDQNQKQYTYFEQQGLSTRILPQADIITSNLVHVASRSTGAGDLTVHEHKIFAFLTENGYFMSQDTWKLYPYSDWCEDKLNYYDPDYPKNIQVGIIPCFTIGG